MRVVHEPIGNSCQVDSGPAFESKYFGEAGTGVRLLRGDNIEPGALRWMRTRTWPEERIAGYEGLFVEPGDLILGMDRPVVSAGLKLAQVTPSDVPALLVQRVARIRPKSVNSRYLYHYLTEPTFARHLQRKATGTQLPHVTLRDIRDFAIPRFGPEAERRIVDILEDHLSRLDAANDSLNLALARLNRMTTSALWRTTHEIAEAHQVRLTDVADVRLGRQRSPANHSGNRMRPYLRAANVDWDRLRLDDVKSMNFTEAEEQIYRLEPGDVLLTEASGSPAEVGKSVLYRGVPEAVCFQNTLLRIRCHDADPAFVQKYLLAEARAGRFMPESRGVGINHLGRTRLANLEMRLPRDQNTQQRAADACETVLSSASAIEHAIRNQRVRSSTLRRALLAAAFSGRLTGRSSECDLMEEAVS